MLRDERKKVVETKEARQAEKEKEKALAEKLKKIREKKSAKKEAKKKAKEEKEGKPSTDKTKVAAVKDEGCTLFVRNIGFETDKSKFEEYMRRFGDIQYAVLCMQTDSNG